MEESFKRFKTDHIDLMQIWNVSNPTLLAPRARRMESGEEDSLHRASRAARRAQYGELEAAMKAYKYDFVQIDLAIDNRSAQDRIIPLATDLGMAVLVNSPFGRNRVFTKTQGKPLPDWAKDIDATSWAQFALKYIVANHGGDGGDPGHRPRGLSRGRHEGRAWPAARRRDAEANGELYRLFVNRCPGSHRDGHGEPQPYEVSL